MFEGWENFYLMVGSSAGALIGLMFVVVTLTAGRDRDGTEQGKRLYTSPIVWHLAVVLLLSGAAVAPARGHLTGPENNMFDTWWYGIIPAIVYIGLAGAAVGVLSGAPWSAEATAAALMALLLVSVHAEWDLVTFLAAITEPPSKQSKRRKKS